MSRSLYLVVSLDVEEEGLFTGSYAQSGVSVKNTQALTRLAPLLARKIKPTLFCAYPVLADAPARSLLQTLHDKGCEIAAHLHHWNTPPFERETESVLTRVPAGELSDELFAAKLASVLELARSCTSSPVTSFRMGRWDLHRSRFPLLARAGLLTDASVRPLHGRASQSPSPDHFAAPSDPYWIPTKAGHIFEVPLTVMPLIPAIRPLLTSCRKAKGPLGRLATFLASTTNYWGALALLPVYHPLWAMQAITAYYLACGGQVLSLTWHSSEMQPGATPHLPTEAHVQKLLTRITNYLDWLLRRYDVHSLTMNELRNTLGPKVSVQTAAEGDWTVSR